MKRTAVSVSLDLNYLTELDRRAYEERRSRSELVNEAISAYLTDGGDNEGQE